MPDFERLQWKDLKDKHAKAIRDKKIVFRKELGPTLDKMVQKIKKEGPKAGSDLAEDVIDICDAYQKAIKGMGDPAERELRERLGMIKAKAAIMSKH